jgi:hypothetical protein
LSQKAAQEGSEPDEVKDYERVKYEFCGRLQKCSFENLSLTLQDVRED